MALGARTLIRSWNDTGGHHLRVSMPGTTGANLTQPETIDLSTAGALTIPAGLQGPDDDHLFPLQVDVMKWIGTQAAAGRRVLPHYNRAAAGAPATGALEFWEVGAAGALALTADATNLSTTTFILEFTGV